MTCKVLRAVLWLAVSLNFSSVLAQSADSPVAHMNALSEREELLSQKYMSYMSEVAHGERARKMEKRRTDLVNTIKESIREANKLRPYKGDASLKDAYRDYWTVQLSVFNEDYEKIVDMEEVAEQSYDAMEAYLLIQEKAAQKLDEAYDRIPPAYTAFAEKNNVRLVEAQKTKLSRKLNQASQVNKYFNQLYLIYFKSSVQESLMMKAVNALDVNSVEQSKSSMEKYAIEGLARLDTVKPFKGDGSMANACRKVLEFQKMEAQKAIAFTSFLITREEFEKIKKTYDTKPAAQRSKTDTDTFNKAVNDYNAAIAVYNKVNGELNNGREKVINHWVSTRKQFLDRHIPHK